jgi:hypothetical protein
VDALTLKSGWLAATSSTKNSEEPTVKTRIAAVSLVFIALAAMPASGSTFSFTNATYTPGGDLSFDHGTGHALNFVSGLQAAGTLVPLNLQKAGEYQYVLLGTLDYNENTVRNNEVDTANLAIALTLGGATFTFNPSGNVQANSSTSDTTMTFSGTDVVLRVDGGYTLGGRIVVNTVNDPGTASNSMTFQNCASSSDGCTGGTPDGGGANPDRGWLWARFEVVSTPEVNAIPAAVPEPGTIALVGLGLVALGLVAHRRAKK